MDDVVKALAAQHAELAGILDGLTESAWHLPTRCEGWDVADVVLHLAQTDDAAIASARGNLAGLTAPVTETFRTAPSVDEAAAEMVQSERGLSHTELFSRWSLGAGALHTVLENLDLSTRVRWVVGDCQPERSRPLAWPRRGFTPVTSPMPWVSKFRRASASG